MIDDDLSLQELQEMKKNRWRWKKERREIYRMARDIGEYHNGSFDISVWPPTEYDIAVGVQAWRVEVKYCGIKVYNNDSEIFYPGRWIDKYTTIHHKILKARLDREKERVKNMINIIGADE